MMERPCFTTSLPCHTIEMTGPEMTAVACRGGTSASSYADGGDSGGRGALRPSRPREQREAETGARAAPWARTVLHQRAEERLGAQVRVVRLRQRLGDVHELQRCARVGWAAAATVRPRTQARDAKQGANHRSQTALPRSARALQPLAWAAAAAALGPARSNLRFPSG